MSQMSTLHEIAVHKAVKQPGMADAITEEAPVLAVVKWKPASHGLWNVAEKLTDVKGPGWVEADAPLPVMSASSDLVHTDLAVLGGTIEVPTQRALKFGGAARYFAERQDIILRKAGMDTEIALVLKNWLKSAVHVKNARNAGGKGKGCFLLAVRFDEVLNCGLYDPDQFDSGRLLRITPVNGGNEHNLVSPDYLGSLGYAVAYRGNFGWQNLEPKVTCSAIVNIDEANSPTPAMIDDMLADVRARQGTTYIVCSPRGRTYGLNPYKHEHVQLANVDTKVSTLIETWNTIPVIASHNFNEMDNVKV